MNVTSELKKQYTLNSWVVGIKNKWIEHNIQQRKMYESQQIIPKQWDNNFKQLHTIRLQFYNNNNSNNKNNIICIWFKFTKEQENLLYIVWRSESSSENVSTTLCKTSSYMENTLSI